MNTPVHDELAIVYCGGLPDGLEGYKIHSEHHKEDGLSFHRCHPTHGGHPKSLHSNQSSELKGRFVSIEYNGMDGWSG